MKTKDMYNGAEIEDGCIFFKHKEARLTMDFEKDIQNGNLVIAYADGSMLKSDSIGKEYFRNNFESINLPNEQFNRK